MNRLKDTAAVAALGCILTLSGAVTPATVVASDKGQSLLSPEMIRENHIPGAWPDAPTSSVPLYLNRPSMYYPAAGGGLCWASATASILGYWDRTPYNGVQYWNLFRHGIAPLHEPALPIGPGHDGADVKAVVEWFANAYYGEGRVDEDAIIREFVNAERDLNFNVIYVPAAHSFNAKTNHFAAIQTDIDAGRPVSIGSYGNYFGGAHQVPVTGYLEMSNAVNSMVFVHRNTGDQRREYVNPFADTWGGLDMNRILPGGVPVDRYEAEGDNSAVTPVTIDPDHTYAFRQTHNFSTPADTDWVRLEAVAGRRYTLATTGLGPDADTVLTLFNGDGLTVIKQDEERGDAPAASLLHWYCWADGPMLIRVSSGGLGSHGHAAFYHLEVSYEASEYTNRPPVILGLTAMGDGKMHLNWESLPDQRYSIHYSTNLQEGFHVLQSNIFAVQEMHAFLDEQPPSASKFYKITVDP